MGYWPVAYEGKGSNCFSITQLVRQKKQKQSLQMQVEEKFIWGKKRKKNWQILLINEYYNSPLVA